MPRAARKSKAASGGLASGPVAKKSKASSEVTDLAQPDSQSFADNVKTAANVTAIVAGVSTTDSKETLLVKDPGLIPCDNLNKNQAIRPEQLSMENLTNLPGMTQQSQALLPSLEEMMNWPGSDPISGEIRSKLWFHSVHFLKLF